MKSSFVSALRSYFLPTEKIAEVKDAICGLTPQDKVDLAAGLHAAGELSKAGLDKALAENDAVPHPSYTSTG